MLLYRLAGGRGGRERVEGQWRGGRRDVGPHGRYRVFGVLLLVSTAPRCQTCKSQPLATPSSTNPSSTDRSAESFQLL